MGFPAAARLRTVAASLAEHVRDDAPLVGAPPSRSGAPAAIGAGGAAPLTAALGTLTPDWRPACAEPPARGRPLPPALARELLDVSKQLVAQSELTGVEAQRRLQPVLALLRGKALVRKQKK